MKIITNTSIHCKHGCGKIFLKTNGKGFLFHEFFGYKQLLSDISYLYELLTGFAGVCSVCPLRTRMKLIILGYSPQNIFSTVYLALV